MKLTRIYYQGELEAVAEVCLSAAASHHLIHVLRVNIADPLIVFNGDGSEYLTKITAVRNKIVRVSITEKRTIVRESPLFIELVQGVSRGERMDYAIQKAVELGANVITPVFTERCGVKLTPERMARRLRHWQGVIISACEQSGRLVIPVLNTPLLLKQFLALKKEGLKLVCSPHALVDFSQVPCDKRVTLLVGAEGGLSDQEVQHAVTAGYQAMCLGPRILRTETAAIVALSVAQMLWGDMLTVAQD